jgi:hypothetical protein
LQAAGALCALEEAVAHAAGTLGMSDVALLHCTVMK